ncbi:hypothetical protein [Paraburkholderia sp. J63]|uniref:hypothetical protein n=1 Tax=Paraburkholderia sp. J63 TaxID=2805434 RepID=UPI002ABD6DB1|nr:hypothetical protein [Paraburkholderia sp. J63]
MRERSCQPEAFARYRGEMIDRLVASACIEAVLESNVVFAPQATNREILVA